MRSKKQEVSFIKYHPCLANLFTPEESRFILHIQEAEFLKSCGYHTNWSRAEFSKRMGLSKYTFDQCAKKLSEMKLITKKHNTQRNRAYYSFNHQLYDKLIHILSVTNNTHKLIEFCDLHFRKNNRSIESITSEEIEKLRSDNNLKKKHRSTSLITPKIPNPGNPITLNELLPLCQEILTVIKPLETLLSNSQSENQQPPG